jgi:carbonic anhydrase/acetyltransferase-like protein (isoleucine patch superfamily)
MDENTQFRDELVDPSTYIAPTAIVRGDVRLEAEASVWFHAVVRGDSASIHVGRQSNIQDLCVLHADPGFPCTIGNRVTVGHAAIVHGATVEDDCMIGMRAVVMNGARIGAGSIVAAGAVVTEGTHVPPGSVVMGLPAKVRREVTPDDQERSLHAAHHYVETARRFKLSESS